MTANKPVDDMIKEIADYLKIYSSFYLKFTSIPLDYRGIISAFIELENIAGPLPVFRIPDYLGEEHGKALLLYRLQEMKPGMNTLVEFMRAYPTASDAHTEQQYLLYPKSLSELLKLSTSRMITIYLEYYELLFNNIIAPVIKSIGPELKKGRTRHSYDFQIRKFKEILKKHGLDGKLGFFFMHLDGTLRNAFVHGNYYVDEEKLFYFQYNPLTKDLKKYTKTKKVFVDMMVSVITQKMFFNIIVGLRLTGKDTDTFITRLLQ